MCTDLDGEQEALQSAVDELLASCDRDEDRQIIVQQFAGLGAKLHGVKNAIEHKTTAYDILLEHSRLRAAARATTARVRDQMNDDKLTAEELSDLHCELSRARSDLIDLEHHHLEMEALLTCLLYTSPSPRDS